MGIFALIVFFLANSASAQLELDQSKHMGPEELQDKREGVYFTAIPQVGSDPLKGEGLGVDLFLYNNGPKSDPHFAYTPYKSLLELHLFATDKDEREAGLGLDLPFWGGSAWRARVELSYLDDPNALYFGHTAASMGDLLYAGRSFRRYKDYSSALAQERSGGTGESALVTDSYLHSYRQTETALHPQVEYSFWGGTGKVALGAELLWARLRTFDGQVQKDERYPAGRSLLSRDAQNGLPGMGNGFLWMPQLALAYDTRDYEVSPTQGTYLELSAEPAFRALGSDFNFLKTMAQAQYFLRLFPVHVERLVLSVRHGISYAGGSPPLYEMTHTWFIEDEVETLGGPHTLRGYKQGRFVGSMASFSNLELRWRFAEAHFWGQNLDFELVPFVDAGRVWDHFRDYSWTHMKHNEGVGLRVPWNQATVLALDYAISEEDRQFFFRYGHSF